MFRRNLRCAACRSITVTFGILGRDTFISRCLVRRIMDFLCMVNEKVLKIREIPIRQITGRVQSTRDLDREVETVVKRPREDIIRGRDI
jgi:hypothetical protein